MSCRFAATAATYGVWREPSLYTTQLTLKAAPQVPPEAVSARRVRMFFRRGRKPQRGFAGGGSFRVWRKPATPRGS